MNMASLGSTYYWAGKLVGKIAEREQGFTGFLRDMESSSREKGKVHGGGKKQEL